MKLNLLQLKALGSFL